MSLSEKPMVGAQILRAPPPVADKAAPPSKNSYFTLERAIEEEPVSAASPLEDYNPSAHAKPHSPFYCHRPTRTSLEQLKNESRVTIHQSPSLQDLDAGNPPRLSSVGKDEAIRLWPGKHGKVPKRTKHSTQRSGWSCSMERLSKRQRLLVKIMIAVLLVGGAVAIGVGVSKAVGGGVYKNANEDTQIG